MDATRVSDGKLVFNKKIARGGRERKIIDYLTVKDRADDEKNHCVPVLDHFIDDQEQHTEFLVMPILRRFNNPPFSFVDEVVDFVRQTLEVSVKPPHTYSVANVCPCIGTIIPPRPERGASVR